MNRTRRIGVIITATVLALILAITLGACGTTHHDNTRGFTSGNGYSGYSICVKRSNQIRYSDYYCDQHRGGYSEWYLTPGQSAPRIGQRAGQGSLTRPRGRIQNRVPESGARLITPTKAPTSKSPTSTKSKPTKTKSTKSPAKTKSKSSNSGSKSKSGSSSRSGGSSRR